MCLDHEGGGSLPVSRPAQRNEHLDRCLPLPPRKVQGGSKPASGPSARLGPLKPQIWVLFFKIGSQKTLFSSGLPFFFEIFLRTLGFQQNLFFIGWHSFKKPVDYFEACSVLPTSLKMPWGNESLVCCEVRRKLVRGERIPLFPLSATTQSTSSAGEAVNLY